MNKIEKRPESVTVVPGEMGRAQSEQRIIITEASDSKTLRFHQSPDESQS